MHESQASDIRGVGLEPLYKSAPLAALRDPVLYEFLAIADALRDGRARERNLAERDLVKRLRSVHGQDPNLQLLLDAAKLLKPILGELVFVGGCSTALVITDKGAADVRPTYDVDAIAEITSYAGYITPSSPSRATEITRI
jgi:hypothetical protein